MTRIGVANAASTMFISGIGNSPIAGGLPVVVNAATRQIRYAASSERYKTEINSLGTVTAKLVRLRLVSFRVKSDRIGAIQYELIAEEVDTVYPEYVIRDAEGRIPGVRYDEQATNAAQDAEIRHLKAANRQGGGYGAASGQAACADPGISIQGPDRRAPLGESGGWPGRVSGAIDPGFIYNVS